VKILVSAKRSIDADIPLKDGPLGPVPRFPEYCLNPYCEAALEEAVRLTAGGAGEVLAFSLGGPECDEQLRRALALGANRALRQDLPPGADPWLVANAIAELAQAQGADLVLLGASSPCGDSGLVPWLVGQILGWPVAGPAVHPQGDEGLKGRRPGLTLRGRELSGLAQWDLGQVAFSLALPAVVCCDLRLARASIPLLPAQLAARRASLQVLPGIAAGLRCHSLGARLLRPEAPNAPLPDPIGIPELARLLVPLARRQESGPGPSQAAPDGRLLPAAAPLARSLLLPGWGPPGPAELASLALLQRLAQASGGGFDLLVPEAQAAKALEGFGAGAVLRPQYPLPDPARYPEAVQQLVDLLETLPHQRFFFPHSRFGLALVAALAQRRGCAAVSRLTGTEADGTLLRLSHSGRGLARLRPEGDRLAATLDPRRAQPLLASTPSPSFALPPAASRPLATPPVRWAPAPESLSPGGPSLASAPLALGVGRGVLASGTLPLVRTLASLLGAPLAGTRLAVDGGALPGDLQLGQSGRSFYGEFYLALGISGSVQHLAALGNCPTLAAINLDPRAPLRPHCRHFVQAPLETALPALVEELRRLLQDRP
jgi:electron transfer flavoprotein alpha subunit/electron transfer flavoprotein alpha/beta subunit